ncbi:MAG: response regulator [Arenimonas sp.]|nr:response regulator [Arenimonas sp.]MBP6627242.1 response regulator [Arenimonas sp.]
MATKPNVSPARWAGCLLACTLLAAAPVCATSAPSPLRLQRGAQDIAMAPGSRWLRLPAGDRDFTVRLPSGSPAAGPQRYRIWLQGHDQGWRRFDANGVRRYRGLAPGSYRLRTAVANGTGAWQELPVVSLLVQAPWWQNQVTLAAVALGLALALAWWGWLRRARGRRREAWRLAQARQQLAEQHSEAKSRFLATLGHEIRTPMTGVLGMAELLQSSALNVQQRHQVDAIERAGRHLLRLVNDALDLARIEAGKLVLEDAAFEVRPLLDEVAGLLLPLARAKSLGFSLHCEPAVAVALRGDATRVRQILFNLGHNAIKFCESGEVAVQVSAERPSGLRLAVRDTGPGLSAGQQARLFRRFEPGAGDGMPACGGSGLGLAICSELAAAMGGSITVRSEVGAGADFLVTLPLPTAALPAPTAALAPAVAHPLRLLLVEDDPGVADVVVGLLEREGHAVVHAPHGLAALAELEISAFDAALLDLDLPGIDGMALARLVRERGLPLPMLALTARVDAEAEPGARAAGMGGFLRKPVSGERLAEAIAALVR